MKTQRKRFRILDLSAKTRLIGFAAVAVLIPTTILSAMQCKSLVELEAKTKVAVQENLRQTLQQVSRTLESRFRKLATQDLAGIDPTAFDPTSQSPTIAFLKTRSTIPGDGIVISSNCAANKRATAALADSRCVRWLEGDEADRDPGINRLSRYFKTALLRHDPADALKDTLFYQDMASPGEPDGDRVYSFMPMAKPADQYACGFVSVAYSRDYIEGVFLPSAFGDAVQGLPGLLENPDLYIQILDQNQKPVYCTETRRTGYDVGIPFGTIFPRWTLTIGFRNTTIDSLAKSNFQKSLMLTILLVALLVIGIGLTLRATAREMRLAQSKSAFVSNVSHELKTPLALIRLFAETLELDRVATEEKAHDYYRIINNESRRLTQLINNILDFAKIEAGRKDYNFKPTNVAQVLREVILNYEYQITSSGFELTQEIEEHLPEVSGDRDALSQAVLNLLNNAVKYSGEIKSLTISARVSGDFVAIGVTDNGIGIPKREQKKIFEKFYRVSTGLVHDTKGSGLGLALVKHIVEAHHGEVLVESTPGKGSQFTIKLPITRPDGATREAPELGSGGYRVADNFDN